MSLNTCFLWMLLVIRSHIIFGMISVRTPVSWSTTWLDDVGHKLFNAKRLSFEVRVRQDAIVELGTNDGVTFGQSVALYTVIIGGWYNKYSRIVDLVNSEESKSYHGEILDDNEFKGFKVSLSDGKIKLYWRELFCWKSVTEFSPTNGTNMVNTVGISTRNLPGDWRFFEVGDHDHGRQFQTMPSLIDKNFTSSIILTKHSANVGMCSLFCHSNNGCLAFTYNNIHNQCQLHSERYCSVSEQELKTEGGSIHYSSIDDNV